MRIAIIKARLGFVYILELALSCNARNHHNEKGMNDKMRIFEGFANTVWGVRFVNPTEVHSTQKRSKITLISILPTLLSAVVSSTFKDRLIFNWNEG